MGLEDFVIQMTAEAREEVTLRVTESPVGESEAVELGPESLLGRLLAQCRDPGLGLDGLLAKKGLEALGGRLYEALFTGPVQGRFLEALGRSSSQGARGLRLKLQVDFDSPLLAEIHALPWEYLYRAETASFLALDRRFAIVRHLRLPTARELLPLPRPLRVLVAVAAPRGLGRLESEDECRRIVGSWNRNRIVNVEVLPRATLDRLRNALLAEKYQGFHFIGHGQMDPSTGEGLLILEDPRGEAAPTTGQDLAIQLADRSSLRWAFLNACGTGCSSLTRPFSGVAAALLRTGIPAVLAMQSPISDRAAVVFSRTVYRRLAERDPVEAAVSEGRLAIRRQWPYGIEWGTPVLFLRSTEAEIFASEQPLSTKSSSRPLFRPLWLVVVLLLALGIFAYSELGSRSQQPSGDRAGDLQAVTGWGQSMPVREGRPLRIDVLRATVSVRFDGSLGPEFARLVISVEGSPGVIRKPIMGPTRMDLGEAGLLEVVDIDWARRQVTVIPREQE